MISRYRTLKHRFPRHVFSLIELLVVVAIISILAAMLLPALERAKQQAQLASCSSLQRQWGLGQHLYADDNNGACAPKNDPRGGWVRRILGPYLAQDNLPSGSSTWFKTPELVNCPSETENTRGSVMWNAIMSGSYGPNMSDSITYFANRHLHNSTGHNHVEYGPSRYYKVVNAANQLDMGEVKGGQSSGATPGIGVTRSASKKQHFSERHNWRMNILFVDMHVKTHSYQTVVGTPATGGNDHGGDLDEVMWRLDENEKAYRNYNNQYW